MASVLYYLGDVIADKCIVEDREPVATFGIPGLEGTYGLLPPKAIFWVMTIVVGAHAYRHMGMIEDRKDWRFLN